MARLVIRIFFILPILILVTNLICYWSISLANDQKEQNLSGNDEAIIYRIAPERMGGTAYKLVYFVKSPIDVYWKFKTDFDNAFLVKNKYLREHHFITRNGNTVITEDKYTNGPDVYFRWQTTVSPDAHRLAFVLLNPEECGQKYHYGHIQLTSVTGGTRVTQVAYFHFWGASLWANYPWGGGMKDFLSYTSSWEKEMFFLLKDRYDDENSK